MEVSKAGGAGEVSEVQGFESGYAEKVNINKIENKNQLFLYNLKIITAFRNQNINNICSYNTRNAGNYLFKSSIFFNLTTKCY